MLARKVILLKTSFLHHGVTDSVVVVVVEEVGVVVRLALRRVALFIALAVVLLRVHCMA
jgi:hypothetical protein